MNNLPTAPDAVHQSPALTPAVAMKKNTVLLATLCLASLILMGCQTVPEVVGPMAKKPKAAAVEHDTLYNNISVSEAKGVSSPFKAEKGTVFPENKMGYKLILTSNVSMPNLLATQLATTEIMVQMRIYNRGDYDRTLNIFCARGEDRSTYQALGVFFPANRARDIKFTVTEQDSRNLSLIVTPTR
ncbi:MAG: hypothetical protein DUW69_000165 [Verrucomicrobia bacterium]|jgi:hypothetical protein|nr:MAG: hypothetical protein DUW69_000165 [Verrucomicrobiota bacterium]